MEELIQEYRNELAKKIKTFQTTNRCTGQTMASLLGVSRRHVYNILKAEGVTLDDLVRYCLLLKIKVILK